MHTIASLRKTLDLATTNQVRNRIDAIKDVLAETLRRGPNNQILVTDEGVELLRQLQELYDGGLTMTEASAVMRAKARPISVSASSVSPRVVPYDTKPSETGELLALLREELSYLRSRVAQLEDALHATPHPTTRPWWSALREDVDGS